MMDFGNLGIGWRDLVLVAAALIGVYLVLSVMRLFQVSGKRRPPPPAEPIDFGGEPFYVEPPAVETEPAPVAVAAKSAAAAAPSFAKELNRSSLEGEVQRLRREGDLLREQVAHLSEEVSRLKAARNVSPLYNQAMSMAQQGMPAESIAGACGISLGEAELVAALSKSEDEFERENLDEDRDDRYPNPGSRRANG